MPRCQACLDLPQRVDAWKADHFHDRSAMGIAAAKVVPTSHKGLKQTGGGWNSPEGGTFLYRCTTCGTRWVAHVWTYVNDITVEERAPDAE